MEVLAFISEEEKLLSNEPHYSNFEKLTLHSFPEQILIKFNKIEALILTNINLTQPPEGLERLNLLKLDLSNNKLTEIPSCLYKGLKGLQYLNLSKNQISWFDDEPLCLNSIKTLDLSTNKFNNLPWWIVNFYSSSLEELVFSNNKIENFKIIFFSYNYHINKLRKIVLQNCKLSKNHLALYENLQNLEFFDISNDRSKSFHNSIYFKDDLFNKSKWDKLKVLNLSYLSLADIPLCVMKLASLEELYLRGNFLLELPDSIEDLINLKILDISENSISTLPSILAKLKLLTVIRAASNSIDTITDINQLENLIELDLYNNYLTDFSFDISKFISCDFELNYFCVHLTDYETKKTFLRRNFINRFDGPKTKPEEDNNDKYWSEEETEDQHSHCIEYVGCTEEENWEIDRTEAKSCDVTDSDNEWIGAETTQSIAKPLLRTYDQEWIFEDALES